MKVLVTGSSGFIGHHLVRHLKSQGHWIRGVDIEKPKFTSLKDFNEFFQDDLTKLSNCKKATWEVDWVYNLAALNGSIELTTNNKAELVTNNALININMANACIYSKVKRVFFSSSACVYPIGLQDTDKVHALKEEDAYPSNPDSEYGWEKLFSERLWTSYMQDKGLEVRIARFINVYGPECLIDTLRSKAPMALTRKVIEAGDGGEVKIWGDGGQKRTFCYVDDLVNGIDLLMNSDISEPTNIGSDELMSIDELVDLIAKIEGVNVHKVHQLDKVQGVRTRHPDLTKINNLGWERKISMKEGLTRVNNFAHSVLKI